MACSDGRCVADACAGIECDDGSYCVDGECMADPCVPERCESGEVCADGRCLPNPCLGIRCEPGQTCHLVLGSAQCTYAHPLETELPTSSTESQVSSPDPSRTDGDDRLLMPVFETTPGEGNTLSEDPRSEVSAQVEGGGCNALSSERSGSLGLGLLFLVWALRYGRYSRRFGVFLSS